MSNADYCYNSKSNAHYEWLNELILSNSFLLPVHNLLNYAFLHCNLVKIIENSIQSVIVNTHIPLIVANVPCFCYMIFNCLSFIVILRT